MKMEEDTEDKNVGEKTMEEIQSNSKAIDEYRKELTRHFVKDQVKCSNCKILPRPGDKTVRKCGLCTKVFCYNCVSHR